MAKVNKEDIARLRSGDLDWDAIREIFMEEYGIEFDFSKEILAIGKAK